MQNRRLLYWVCQIVGWTSWLLLLSYLSFDLNPEYKKDKEGYFAPILASFVLAGICFIITTHLLRFILKKIKWHKRKISILLLIIITGLIGASFFQCFITWGTEKTIMYSRDILHRDKIDKKKFIFYEEKAFENRLKKIKETEHQLGLDTISSYLPNAIILDTLVKNKIIDIENKYLVKRNKDGTWKQNVPILLQLVNNGLFILIWLILYIGFYYFRKNQTQQVQSLKLQTTVKDLELKTIKAHINPHFIFNALNSIRALVDEDPEGARNAITGLSNILRSSMLVEKVETVTLEKELSIVKDYLDLEKIRFEERLLIDFDIQPETLGLNIPPMILQMMVENAIKHGISKLVKGGLIHLSTFKDDKYLWLVVSNTGQLNTNKEVLPDSGFGQKSTEERLNMLYENKASFEIQNTNNEMVSCTIKIPLNKII